MTSQTPEENRQFQRDFDTFITEFRKGGFMNEKDSAELLAYAFVFYNYCKQINGSKD